MARAEADALLITRHAQIEASELQQRAVQRFIYQETRRQENFESTVSKALPFVATDSHPERLSDQWIAKFHDGCRDVSDDEAQEIWAKILAGEANRPGSFSYRTIGVLQEMDQAEAEGFSILCSFAVGLDIHGGIMQPLVFENQDGEGVGGIYKNHGLSFGVLSTLESIGLVRYSPGMFSPTFSLTSVPRFITISYFGEELTLEMPEEQDNTVVIGSVHFTGPGEQLARVCQRNKVPGFFDYATGVLKRHIERKSVK